MLNALVTPKRQIVAELDWSWDARAMDSLSGHPDVDHSSQATGSVELAGGDERRMHVRAYNHWVSLLDGRDYPSIEDLDPGSIGDFASHSVLLDFTAGRDNPATPYIGVAIREECGITADVKHIDEIPSRSLLTRLTDHYLQIIANRAPIGFEAEFVNQRGNSICYRGILMPFSSDGDTIDFIYGVINWKDVGAAPQAQEPLRAVVAPVDEPEPEPEPMQQPAGHHPHLSWEDGPLHDGETEPDAIALEPDAALADRLCAARDCAEAFRQADSRSRSALYRALSHAYDFALAAAAEPAEFAEILADAGVKQQARAPMTAVAKLVFGVDHDKSRLTEYAAALNFAEREGVAAGAFETFIAGRPGGLKALVAAERAARRPGPRPDARSETARSTLRQAQPISLSEVEADDEFVLVISRRRIGGGLGYEAVALIEDDGLLERAIRKAAP
jgi:hypothetical protein